MDKLKNLGKRILVVLKAAPTWLTAASAVAVTFADEIAPLIPSPWSERVSAAALSVVSVLAAAIVVIRRVSPVPAAERGILPPT